jgi:putative redox protein
MPEECWIGDIMDDGAITEVIAEWQEDTIFRGSNEVGGSVQMGSMEGQPGIEPMEMLLLGLAGCTGVDVVNIMKKKRQPLDGLRIQIKATRAETHPKVYTEIEVVYILQGDGLERKAIEQAIQLSEDKYCSASSMLKASAQIRSSYQIIASKIEAI